MKKAQVWVETVLYTLIGLALIGIALGFIMPKVNDYKDKLLVEQAITSLNALDGKIVEVMETGIGNKRTIEFSMKKGELYFNASGNEIRMILSELNKPYSEPGAEIDSGRMRILSEEGQKKSTAYLKIGYLDDIKYKGSDELKKFTPSSTPYTFSIENLGMQNGRETINIEEISDR